MTRTDQTQETVDEFQRESDIRKLKVQKTLQFVFLPFIIIPCLGIAYLNFRMGNFISAVVLLSIGLALPIGIFWFGRAYPAKFIESNSPGSLKKKTLFWGGLIVFYIGLWFFR